jgi:hypothetical protein
MWQETINYFVFYMDNTRDVLKVIDYLKVRSLHNVISYFWCRGEKSNMYISGGDRNQKKSKKINFMRRRTEKYYFRI